MNLDELSTSISLKPENSDKIESRIYNNNYYIN